MEEQEEKEYVRCADCGRLIKIADADFSLGEDKPICQNCFEAREYCNGWW